MEGGQKRCPPKESQHLRKEKKKFSNTQFLKLFGCCCEDNGRQEKIAKLGKSEFVLKNTLVWTILLHKQKNVRLSKTVQLTVESFRCCTFAWMVFSQGNFTPWSLDFSIDIQHIWNLLICWTFFEPELTKLVCFIKEQVSKLCWKRTFFLRADLLTNLWVVHAKTNFWDIFKIFLFILASGPRTVTIQKPAIEVLGKLNFLM